MTDQRTVTVDVFNEDYGRIYEPFGAWLESMRELLDAVPDDYRDKVMLKFDHESGYDGSYTVVFNASYKRQETDEEVAERLEKESAYRRGRDEVDRQAYERLKAKFETPGSSEPPATETKAATDDRINGNYCYDPNPLVIGGRDRD